MLLNNDYKGQTRSPLITESYANMNIEVDSTSFLTIPTSDQAVVIDFYAFQLSSMLSGQLVKLVLQGQSKQLVVCELVVYGGKIVLGCSLSKFMLSIGLDIR